MKKSFTSLMLVMLLSAASLHAQQPMPANDKEGLSGEVTLFDNSVVTGTVKDNIRKKGEVVVLRDGKKTKYSASGIAAVKIGGVQYITNNSTFYEVIWQGKTISLLRKASQPSGLQYNGTEPMVVSSEGSVDDYFVKKANDASFYLLTKKNQKEVLEKLCSSCTSGIDETKYDADSIRKAVEACDQCK